LYNSTLLQLNINICHVFPFSFQGMAPSRRPSLYLQVGEEIEILNQSDPEWWEVGEPTVQSIFSVYL